MHQHGNVNTITEEFINQDGLYKILVQQADLWQKSLLVKMDVYKTQVQEYRGEKHKS